MSFGVRAYACACACVCVWILSECAFVHNLLEYMCVCVCVSECLCVRGTTVRTCTAGRNVCVCLCTCASVLSSPCVCVFLLLGDRASTGLVEVGQIGSNKTNR
jgi:hypothetical protein